MKVARLTLGGWLRIAITVAILALLFAQIDLRDVLATCASARPLPFAAGFLIYIASQLVSALRWRVLARRLGFAVSWSYCARLYLVGMFFGLAVPSTLGSDGARTLILGREPPGMARALSSVVLDRLIGLVTLVVVAGAAMLLGPSAPLPRPLVHGTVAAAVALMAAWPLVPAIARLLPARTRMQHFAEQDLAPFFREPDLIAKAALLSAVVHGLQILAQKLLADSLSIDVSLGFVAIYHPLVALAAAVPLTIAGFGFREATYAYLLPHAGVPARAAVALGLLWWVVGALGGLGGGLLYAASPALRAHSLDRQSS